MAPQVDIRIIISPGRHAFPGKFGPLNALFNTIGINERERERSSVVMLSFFKAEGFF